MEITDEEYIEHFGAKGMKWGVRKDKSSGKPKVRYEQNKARRPGETEADYKFRQKDNRRYRKEVKRFVGAIVKNPPGSITYIRGTQTLTGEKYVDYAIKFYGDTILPRYARKGRYPQ